MEYLWIRWTSLSAFVLAISITPWSFEYFEEFWHAMISYLNEHFISSTLTYQANFVTSFIVNLT